MPEDYTGLSAWEMELLENLRVLRDDQMTRFQECWDRGDEMVASYRRGAHDALDEVIKTLENRGR